MTHQEFVEAYHRGTVKVQVDPVQAGKYLSRKLLLPVLVTPVIGVGAALVLWGLVWVGLLLVIAGFFLPRIVKFSAPGFVLTRALEEESIYQEVIRTGIMKVERPGS